MIDNGKYIILSDGTPKGFETPRQLIEINGEPLIKRTIRLLKENGIEDILITSHDKRFNDLGAKRYEPKYNDWDYVKKTGYWLSAFPIELLNEPITFLFGDVYYSENAIKKIINTETKDNLFFCTYENKNYKYIKNHDEPLAYKVVDYVKFKKHIERVKTLKDKGLCCREPIVWELYRSINGQDINVHKMTGNYIAINDESCDIDTLDDIIKLKKMMGGNIMVKCEVIKDFILEKFDQLKNVERKNPNKNKKGELYVNDTFECDKQMADYLMGDNAYNIVTVKVIEVIPEEVKEEKSNKTKKSKKKKTSKK